MRRWNLDPDSPLRLVLASDVRLSEPDYLNDHIWELSLGWGSPPGLVIETTYGLRAQAMKIFPSFAWRGQDVTEIKRFHSAPRVREILSNYALIEFDPFRGIKIQSEYWVPTSQSLAGRLTIASAHADPGPFRVRLHGALIPREPGQSLGEETLDGARVLAGRTEDLYPVLFVTGGAQVEATHAPALAIERVLGAGRQQVIQWTLASLGDTRTSFVHARQTLRMQWEEQTARIERVNSSMVEFYTGNEEWDAVLHFAQISALGAFLGHDGWLPHPSIVASRDMDSGYSSNGSGRDHWQGWSGQKSTTTVYLIPQVLPAAPELAKGLLRNLIHVQRASGHIDGSPGLAGQRQGSNAVPLLAGAAWEIFSFDRDQDFLREIYQRLGQFVDSWVSGDSDIDHDGAPEWMNTLQADFPNWPTFARWHDWGENFDIRFAETPDLPAFLLAETRALSQMAEVLGLREESDQWSAKSDAFGGLLETWPHGEGRFLPRDRDLHETYSGKSIATLSGSHKKSIKANLKQPARLVVRVVAEERQAKDTVVRVVGRGDKGRFVSERIDGQDFEWYWDIGTYTTRAVFHSVRSIEVSGAAANSRTQVFIPDLQGHDLTQLLPLFAIDKRRGPAVEAARDLLTEPGFYWQPRGIATVPAGDLFAEHQDDTELLGIRMDWNAMLGEALINLGSGTAAAELMRRLLETASQSLRSDHGWRERYHPELESGSGRRHSVIGAPPLRLILKCLGIRLHSPWEVDIIGPYLFDSEMMIRWQGLEVLRNADVTEVKFPNGYIVVSPGSQPRRIHQERPG